MPATHALAARENAPSRPIPDGSLILGATVDAFAASREESDGTRWIELAYAVSMVDSDVTLSKEDFERCVANHRRYPCVPVVIEHADTDWFGDRAWCEPHGYVEELRVGEREVTDMNGTSRTAATLEGRVSFDEATAPLVGPGRKWRYGSVTVLKGAVDEATGASLGALLWSWSLTAHPRLTGLLPITASLDPSALTHAQAARLRAALERHPSTEKPMTRYLELAARFSLVASSEDDARDKVHSLASLGAEALRALSLAPTATAQELASKLSSITVAAAKVTALEAELTTLRAERDAREKAELDAHLAELFAVHPELKAAERALRFQAEHDLARFREEHPRPTPAELLQCAQHGERLATIVPPQGAQDGVALDENTSAAVLSIVRTHIAIARAEGRDLSFGAALQELGG